MSNMGNPVCHRYKAFLNKRKYYENIERIQLSDPGWILQRAE